jgi:Domain of unknown function (DUF4157)
MFGPTRVPPRPVYHLRALRPSAVPVRRALEARGEEELGTPGRMESGFGRDMSDLHLHTDEQWVGRDFSRIPVTSASQRDRAAKARPQLKAGTGRPLDPVVQSRMEALFSADFSTVRVQHDAVADGAARSRGARAFTYGENITFADGRYAPGRQDGSRLLAHELAHVLQQRAAAASGCSRPASAAGAGEAQATRIAEAALTGVRLAQRPVPALGPQFEEAAAGELEAEAEMLALLQASVGASDTVAQERRVDRLMAIVAAIPFWQAKSLAARLAKPAPDDRLATAFIHRLSRATRQLLLGRLEARAATEAAFYSQETDPRKDPKYVDNVLQEVRCWLVLADRYTVMFNGGTKVVVNADIDWTKTSTAVPIVDIQADEPKARAAVRQWQDVAVAGHYNRAVAFYRGPGGVVLPTWFSPETAPATYALIMGVNAQLRPEAQAIVEELRKIRNGMIVGAILGGVLRFGIRIAPGGGGFGGGGRAPVDPFGERVPETPGGKPADPVGTKPAEPVETKSTSGTGAAGKTGPEPAATTKPATAKGAASTPRAERVSELATEDPGRGTDKVTIREAKDAVTMEELGPEKGVKGPVRRANPARYPGEQGADFVDADGQLWDHKVAYPKTGEQGQSTIGSLNDLVADMEAELARGENIMLNHMLLNDTELTYLLRQIAKRGLSLARIRFIPPL